MQGYALGGFILSPSQKAPEFPVSGFAVEGLRYAGFEEAQESSSEHTIGALTITYNILGVPYSNYSRMGPKTLF